MNETLQLFLSGLNVALLATLFVVIPKKEKGITGRKVVLDSCALIDGRIVELAESGFTPETLVVPSFIIRELQMLADGSDSHKRERARYGLDVANKLKELARVRVVVDRRTVKAKTTDDKLIELARTLGAQLYTTDFNLSKVAEVEGVKVLNVNELAQRLRPTYLTGEKMTIKIVQKGSGRAQGVGYSDDGTMVVVDRADRMVGQTVDVVVDRMLGTLAGKMIFAKLQNQPDRKPSSRRTSDPKQTMPKKESEEFVSDLRRELR